MNEGKELLGFNSLKAIIDNYMKDEGKELLGFNSLKAIIDNYIKTENEKYNLKLKLGISTGCFVVFTCLAYFSASFLLWSLILLLILLVIIFDFLNHEITYEKLAKCHLFVPDEVLLAIANSDIPVYIKKQIAEKVVNFRLTFSMLLSIQDQEEELIKFGKYTKGEGVTSLLKLIDDKKNKEENSKIIFTLDAEQKIKFEEWAKDKPASKATTGEQFKFCFIPTGLGVVVTVNCLATDTSIDLTNYEDW